MERDIDVITKPGEDFIVPSNMYAKELPHDSFDPIVIPMTLFVVHAFSVRTRIGAEVPRAFNVATTAEVPCSVALLVLNRARLAESCCAEDDSSTMPGACPSVGVAGTGSSAFIDGNSNPTWPSVDVAGSRRSIFIPKSNK